MSIIGIDPSLRATGVSDGKNHMVVRTSAVDTQTQEQNLLRRSSEIVHGIDQFIQKSKLLTPVLYVESPSYASLGHIHEMGWVLARLHYYFDHLKIVMVPPSTWRKALFSKGNIAKDAIPLAAFKKFGIEIEGDTGTNMLEAYLLHKYGEMVESGQLTHTTNKLRGQKRRKAA